MPRLVPALLLLLVPVAAVAQGTAVVLDNFEAGVDAWETNDFRADLTGDRATYASIGSVEGRAPGAVGERVGLMAFEPATRGWASVSLDVDGALWQRERCERLSLWLRGVGPEGSVELTLRGLYDNPETGRRDLDVAFSRSIRVTEGWHLLLLELDSFRTRAGRALGTADVGHIETLQFVEAPEVERLSFEVDDVQAETADYQHATPAPAAPATTVDVDFAALRSRALVQIGANLPGGIPRGVALSVGERLRQLTPCVARLKLSDHYTPDGSVDEARLRGMIEWIQDNAARPLICLDRPPAGSADIFSFARLCGQVVKSCAAYAPGIYYEVFDEPLYRQMYATIRDATTAYDMIAEAVKQSDPKALVGGMGESAPWRDNVLYFLEHAKRLDFLSVHFYGAHSASVTDARLVQAALEGAAADLPDQLTLADLARQAGLLRKEPTPVFVTEAWMNSVQDQAGQAADPRAQAPLGGAWFAAFLASAAPYVDKVLPRQLYGEGWGLADAQGDPLPPFWAAWLQKTYCPRGSAFAYVKQVSPTLHVYAARTATACNVLVVALEPGRHQITVVAHGTGALSQVRGRALGGEANEIAYGNRPTHPRQAVSLDGPSVLVLQFIPSR